MKTKHELREQEVERALRWVNGGYKIAGTMTANSMRVLADEVLRLREELRHTRHTQNGNGDSAKHEAANLEAER